jgi:hypothetical protein
MSGYGKGVPWITTGPHFLVDLHVPTNRIKAVQRGCAA